jgi:phage FluMu gp28-like protein
MGNAKVIPANPDRYFLPYQAKWIDDNERLKLMQKSRQIGLSLSSAFGSVARTAPSKTRFDHWVSSRDEIQAKLFLEDCKLFSKMLDRAAKDLDLIVIDSKKKTSAYVLEFANGKRIHSMSSNPDAQAGKRGGRTLDEFALHPDPKKLYSIAYPGITWGGQLEVISTHRGSHNFFNELVKDVVERGNPKGFSLHTVTLQDALDQGFLYKLQAVLPSDDERQAMDEAMYFDFIKAGCAAEEQFLQEYMCQPADDNSAFLPYDLIASCEYFREEKWEFEKQKSTGNLYMGVDIGRKHDLTVFWIMEQIGRVFFTRKIVPLKNTPFSEQQRVFYELIELPGMRRVCGDESGLGMQLVEQAKEKYGEYKVEGVTFTGPTKEALAYPLRSAFEDGNIRIPMDDEIRADLRSIKKTITSAGNIRFEADRGPGGHADRFWAAALALHASSQDECGDFDFESTGEECVTSGSLF